MLNWIFTFVFTVTAYLFITAFGIRAGEQQSALDAATALVRNPINFALVILGSALYGVAAFYAIRASSYGTSIVISLGVVVSFVISAYWTSSSIAPKHIVGIVVVLVGVWLLQ